MTKLVDGTLRRKSRHTRIARWVSEILEEDIMSTYEILTELKNRTYRYNGREVPIKNVPSLQRLVNILNKYPEFTRVNAKTERPALWGLK